MNLTIKITATTLAVGATIATLLLLYPSGKAHSDSEITFVPKLTQAQETWKGALRWCESRGVDSAINAKDRDGTPSYGRYQFKPSTFALFAKRYNLASTTDYMNGEAQDEIVSDMILDATVTNTELRTRQFPDCIQNKIGLPPR